MGRHMTQRHQRNQQIRGLNEYDILNCYRKTVYETRGMAIVALREFLKRKHRTKKERMSTYRCKVCRKFHIGRDKKVNKGGKFRL